MKRRKSWRFPTGRLFLLLALVAGYYLLRQVKLNQPNAEVSRIGGYDQLSGCQLLANRGNDGDSFHVRCGSREFELRLYYVDCPESYLSDSHQRQRDRVAEQAEYFGSESLEQTVSLGLQAKQHSSALLSTQPFTVYTNWEPVFGGERVYGFVQLSTGSYLCESLVKAGLARIHTKGEALPTGKSFFEFRNHLRQLESESQANRIGGWQ